MAAVVGGRLVVDCSNTTGRMRRSVFPHDSGHHDRGSIAFPRESHGGELLGRTANVNPEAAKALRSISSVSLQQLVGDLFRLTLAILHSPQYQDDHSDALALDWAHLPIPKDRKLFAELVTLGRKIRILLDGSVPCDKVVEGILGKGALTIGVSRKRDNSQVGEEDLVVSIAYFGAARGKWVPRAYADGEAQHAAWGENTGDLFINDDTCFGNVPEAVWRYELGGYPVLKKWLGYRQASRRDGRSLTLPERQHFRSMIQRIAALLVLLAEADTLYERAAATAFSAEELGLRRQALLSIRS